MVTDLHPDLAELALLVGRWAGDGMGVYPTIEAFAYYEEITFSAVAAKPFLHYVQRTMRSGEHLEAGTPLHTETGYWRSGGPGRVEVMLAQPTGIVELQEGTVEGGVIHLRSTSVGRSATAKEVVTLERNFDVDGAVMRYRLLMGAVGESHQLHLEALLRRVSDEP